MQAAAPSGGHVFSPNSPQAQTILNFLYWTTGIGAVILIIVSVGVFYSALRHRSGRRAGEPPQVFGSRNLELAWTAAPTVLLIVLFGSTVNIMRQIDPDPAQQQPDVVVTGYQWWWHVEYPQAGVVTANEIHIPIGKQVLFQLKGADVIHSFWVPELGPKRDMIPGDHINHLWLRADTPGVYLGACTEYCGTQHAWMRIRVIAQPQAEFDQWLQDQQRVITVPTEGDVARGAQVFQQNTCVNCHAIQQDGGNWAGPSLAHLGSRQTLGAGVIENTPENLARWIANPDQFKPGVNMPGYQNQLSEADIRALVAFLESLQ